MPILFDKPVVNDRIAPELVEHIRSVTNSDPFKHDPITAEIKIENIGGNDGVSLETDDSQPRQITIILTGMIFEKSVFADYYIGNYINLQDVREAISKAEGEFDTIHLKIDSPGGLVKEGNAIINYLKSRPETINTECLAEAASMAGVLFTMGKKRIVHEDTSRIMIHEATSCWCGRAADMRSGAKQLENINESMAAIYSSVSKQSKDWYMKKMSEAAAGYWFTTAEAIEYGIATELTAYSEGDSGDDKNALANKKENGYKKKSKESVGTNDQSVPKGMLHKRRLLDATKSYKH